MKYGIWVQWHVGAQIELTDEIGYLGVRNSMELHSYMIWLYRLTISQKIRFTCGRKIKRSYKVTMPPFVYWIKKPTHSLILKIIDEEYIALFTWVKTYYSLVLNDGHLKKDSFIVSVRISDQTIGKYSSHMEIWEPGNLCNEKYENYSN